MSEIKLLSKLYSNKAIKPRYVGNNNRSIKNRILALDRDKEFLMEKEVTVMVATNMMGDGPL